MAGPNGSSVREALSWPPSVCIALEELALKRAEAQNVRKSKFDEIKSIRAEIAELTKASVFEKDQAKVKEYQEQAAKLKAEGWDVYEQIDALQADISWFADRQGQLITEAAKARRSKQPQLFETIDTDTKPPPPAEPVKPKDKPADSPKVKRAEPQPVGENQHLEASVNELDMREDLKGALAKAGCEKVADIAKVIDAGGDDAAGAVEKQINVDAKAAAAIVHAVGKYRREHRKQIVAKERAA